MPKPLCMTALCPAIFVRRILSHFLHTMHNEFSLRRMLMFTPCDSRLDRMWPTNTSINGG